jgi:hypothetical protein
VARREFAAGGLFGALERERTVIVLGLILLIVGYLTGLSLLYTVGGILLVVGVVFFILGNVGRPVGGRKVWY